MRGGDNSSKEDFDRKLSAAAIKDLIAKHQRKDAFWTDIEQRFTLIKQATDEDVQAKLQLKKDFENRLQTYYEENIIDKKSWLSKVYEPSEQYISIVIDIMMYCKYKIMNSLSIEGVAEMLSKVKVSLLKIIQGPEFIKGISIQSC